MKPASCSDEIRFNAALYVAGALTDSEAQTFLSHVEAGCEACARELDSFQQASALFASAFPVSPPARLRQRLFERVQQESASGRPQVSKGEQTFPKKTPIAAQGFFVLRQHEGQWQESGIPGVTVRYLTTDPVRQTTTVLVRMAPGTRYPSHPHSGGEECLVLEGDLCVGDTELRAGDFQRAEAGTEHGIQSTRHGCLLLVVAATDDLQIASPSAT